MTTSTANRSGIQVCILALAITCGGCRSTSTSAPPHVLSKTELTAAEIQYGRGVKRDRNVVYKPDVVIVDQGPDAIRAAGADGFSWTIDASASNANQLTVGKIAFVTGRCVGRVLSAKREGSDLKLILGPVDLTEIFQKLEVNVEPQPLDLTQAIQYPLPQLPGMKLPLSDGDLVPLDEVARRERPQVRFLPVQNIPQMPGIIPNPLSIELQTEKPLSNADGIGMEFRNDDKGMRVVVQMQLRVNKPTLEAHLSINGGQVDARLILHNAAGVHIAFDSAVNQNFPGEAQWEMPLGGFSIPLAGPVPLSFDVRQDMSLDAEFQAHQAAFNAGGDYDINADLGLTYHNSQFAFVGPKGVTIRQSIMTNMHGVSVKASSLGLRHAITITGGLGGAGFTAGPQLVISTRVDIRRGSDIGIIQCRGASLMMNVKGGVGWTIPRLFTKFVNFFLKLVNLSPIQDHGGISTDWDRLFTQAAQTRSAVCGN